LVLLLLLLLRNATKGQTINFILHFHWKQSLKQQQRAASVGAIV
jgi:hypothetical protein